MKSSYDVKKMEILSARPELRGCNVNQARPKFKCFQTGDDIRGNQHPALQSLHTLYHRRHNQHAERLKNVNPHWDDERLFQESRFGLNVCNLNVLC